MRKLKILKSSVLTVMIIILSMFYCMPNFSADAATTYSVIFPVNNGCKIAHYQKYDPKYKDHDGVDIHSSGDDYIYAAKAGTVEAIGNSCPHTNEYENHINHKYKEMGNYIKIKGNDGVYYWYYHLLQNTLLVSKGDKVTAGQAIATMGSSGASTGKHLHFRMTTGSSYYSTAIMANPVGTYSGQVNYSNGPYVKPKKYDYVAINQDNYYLKNSSTGTYLNISGAKAANGQAAVLAAKKDANSYKFQAKGSKDAGYNLISMINSKYVLNAYSDNPSDGCKVTLYENLSNSTQKFKFEKSGNGYIIHNAYNEDIVLTPSGSNVLLKKRTGAANQVWTLESVKSADKKLTGISIGTPATKTTYWRYETLQTNGLVLKAAYSDGSTKNITSGYTTQYSFSNIGECNVTISYTENNVTQSTSYSVTVKHPFSGGGTVKDPYLIENQDQLSRLATIINSTSYSTYNTLYYKQTADIDLGNKAWTPIGIFYENASSSNTDNNNAFNGHYNGDCHKISGLNVIYDRNYSGLFGRINADAVIENLSVNGSVVSTAVCVGGIVGEIGYGGTVKKCDFTGAVTGANHVGGIAGKIHRGGTIDKCYVNGTINATNDNSYAGGIISTIQIGDHASSVDVLIENCYFAGKINAATNGAFGSNITNGDVKQNTASFDSNCYLENSASGAVAGKDQSGCEKFTSSKLKNAASYLSYPYVSAGLNQNDGYPVFAWQQTRLVGDINGDKDVSISDLIILKKHFAYGESLDSMEYSDMNSDGKINVFDFIILKRLLIS